MSTTHAPDGILLASGTNEVEFIEFFVGENSYGVNVSKVQRVLALRSAQLTALAHAPRGVLGAVLVQGKPILLIDLRTALALGGEPPDKDRQLVMVTRFNKRTTAYLIDGIAKIHRTSWADFQPMTGALGGPGGGYTTGTIRIEQRIVLVLDLERLLLDFVPEEERPGTVPTPDAATRHSRAAVRIIYAEDSAMVRRLTLDVLRAAGFEQIAAFTNGQEAHDHLVRLRDQATAAGRTLRDEVDLIITDIEMPQMDGLTLCRQVKTQSGAESIPAVVVYSSLINEEMARKCRSVGADAQLSKPHGEEIVALIDRLCGSAAPAAAPL
jgi:two-component system chemotaxis response regulator CheV